MYEWYYHAQACFQSTGAGSSKYWRWNKKFQQVVVKAQASDGHWSHGKHFHGDSDIYRTTMTILMLEVYYRYAPMTKVYAHSCPQAHPSSILNTNAMRFTNIQLLAFFSFFIFAHAEEEITREL